MGQSIEKSRQQRCSVGQIQHQFTSQSHRLHSQSHALPSERLIPLPIQIIHQYHHIIITEYHHSLLCSQIAPLSYYLIPFPYILFKYYSYSYNGQLYIILTSKAMADRKEVNELVINRLKKERKDWRSDHPFGFVAKPINNADGTTNMLKWECEIPGPKESPWEHGSYHLSMDFSHDFPVRPPKCVFKPVLPHPNIYPSGTVCLSILNEQQDWKPHISVRLLLLGIQKLLKDEPNIQSPAQQEPLLLYKNNRDEYLRRVKSFALNCRKKQ